MIARGDDLLAVEVKAQKLGRPKLARAARSFLDAYRPKELLVVNTGLRHVEEVDTTEVRWIWPQGLAAAVERRGDAR